MTSRLDPRLGAVAVVLATLVSCRQDMHNQPRMRPYRPSAVFADGSSSRLPPSGTVARGQLHADALLESGLDGDKLSTRFPFPVTAAVLARGQERFDIFCVPCHGLLGRGDGPVARRGFFPRVADLQQDRLRYVAEGYIFGVVTNGFNTMPAYGAQVGSADRWAIIAYLRALQLSQHASANDVPEGERQRPAEDAP